MSPRPRCRFCDARRAAILKFPRPTAGAYKHFLIRVGESLAERNVELLLELARDFYALSHGRVMPRSRKRRDRPDIDQLMRSLQAKEEQFLAREFLAPAVTGGEVRVRIGGVVCRLHIQPRSFAGWGVFRPLSHDQAELIRPASLSERREYLRLFPLVRLILCRRAGERWLASPASFGDHRLQFEGLAPVLMVDDAQQFDTIAARYDGSLFWFDEVDARRDPSAAAYLREALAASTSPDDLNRKGITAEERAAYEVNYWTLLQAEQLQAAPESHPGVSGNSVRRRGRRQAPVDVVAERLSLNLSHAGAQLVEYLERGDSYRVTYSVDGQRFTSSVNKEDLTVHVAGICLSGEDRLFDLASLVGVLREGEQGHGLVRVGQDGAAIDEENYWRVHPRR